MRTEQVWNLHYMISCSTVASWYMWFAIAIDHTSWPWSKVDHTLYTRPASSAVWLNSLFPWIQTQSSVLIGTLLCGRNIAKLAVLINRAICASLSSSESEEAANPPSPLTQTHPPHWPRPTLPTDPDPPLHWPRPTPSPLAQTCPLHWPRPTLSTDPGPPSPLTQTHPPHWPMLGFRQA